ncbi:MAG: thioredoxin family protein [Firmicutes bacterium]|nr:thioredoxin family protein [Bacillota bacterium]
MVVKVLGTGCKKCVTTYNNVKVALEELGIEAEVVKVEDLPSIMSYGVMSTPGLVVDERVVFMGKVPSVGEIKKVLVV